MTTSIAFTSWQNQLNAKYGAKNIIYREYGANGYNRLDFDDNGPKMTPVTGPHYMDAAPINENPYRFSGKLLGTFDFHKDGGIFFFM